MSSADAGLEAYLDVEERNPSAARALGTGNVRRLSGSILRHPAPFLGGLAMVLVGTAAALLEPWIFGYAIDHAIVPRDPDLLGRLVLAYLAVVCARVLAVIGQGYLFEVLGQRVTQDLRLLLFSHLQRLPLAFYDRHPAGRLLTRVTNDVASLSEMFSAGFVSMASNALLVAGILLWLLKLDLRLGAVVGTVFLALVALATYFSARLKVAYREARSKLSALNAFLAENILGMRVVHLFNRQERHRARFDRINRWYADAQEGTIRVYALFQPAITLSSGLAMAGLIWFGGREALGGRLSLGLLVAFFSYALSLFQPVREIADKWNVFLSGMTSAERIYSVLEWDTELAEDAPPVASAAAPVTAVAPLALRGHIVFENVWFAYVRDHWVLRDFSVEIPAGSRVGVVGHTGAGKTTLISLLLRFYEPQRGRILIDGRDIREYDRRELRRAIGIVQQDVFLFSGSIADNVTLWEPPADPAGLLATLAELGVPVDELEARAGARALQERGANRSQGERQVLAFARALAASPSIWILDEATANLDSRTEERLQTALADASRGRTAILIAHRLATVRTADLILVLHKGALVERGSHAELLRLEGLYARLYRYQRAQEGEEAPPTHTLSATEPGAATATEPRPFPAGSA